MIALQGRAVINSDVWAKKREIPHIRRPTASQERRGKRKSACCVRNDSEWVASAYVGAEAPTPKSHL